MFWKAFAGDWSDLDEVGLDNNNYCGGWLKKFIYSNFITRASEYTVVILNAAIAFALTYLSAFMKRHTTISAFLSADNICSSDGEANEATSAQVSRFWKFLCFNNQVKFGEVNV